MVKEDVSRGEKQEEVIRKSQVEGGGDSVCILDVSVDMIQSVYPSGWAAQILGLLY